MWTVSTEDYGARGVTSDVEPDQWVQSPVLVALAEQGMRVTKVCNGYYTAFFIFDALVPSTYLSDLASMFELCVLSDRIN